MKFNAIALFCGSSDGKSRYGDIATAFGKQCAERNITLIYGGASIGLMGKAATEALKNGGKVIGIAPSFFTPGTVLADFLPEMILVDSMSERKQLFEKMADAFVALPGSFGTMDELFEALTNAQLGLHQKPIAILNAYGYYDHLIAQLAHFEKEGFLHTSHRQLLLIADDMDTLFAKIEQYQYPDQKEWLSKIKTAILLCVAIKN